MEKFQITTLSPPKVWVSGFMSVNRNGILVSAIMKKWYNETNFLPSEIIKMKTIHAILLYSLVNSMEYFLNVFQ